MSRAIVLGGGADELVAAHVLARAGWQVTVIEPFDVPEAMPGWFPQPIATSLGLSLKVQQPDPWITVPLDGESLVLSRDIEATARAIARFSPRDAQRWPAYCERMATLAAFLAERYLEPPPDPLATGARDLAQLGATAWAARRLGRAGLEDLMRILPISAADWLDDAFECDALKGALAAAGVSNLHQGPRSGGTALAMLHAHVGSPRGVFRAPMTHAVAALRALPGITRRSAMGDDNCVERIVVERGRATGVALANGEVLEAGLVLSGLDPQRTLLDWVDADWIDPVLAREVQGVRSRGVAAGIEFQMNRDPGFDDIVLAPSLDELERAYDAVKYGEASPSPIVEAHTAREDGRVRVIAHVQYAPMKGGDALLQSAVAAIDERFPGFRDSFVEVAFAGPAELAARRGWREGQPHQAELALDQFLWMRPCPSLARYRTPIAGLWLCGQAMHPGAGVQGASGWLAAKAALQSA